MMLGTAGPVAVRERVNVVDVLRGMALLGILIVNLGGQGVPVYGVAADVAHWINPLDQVGEWFIRLFAEGKFYPLFSMLFGWGLATQMLRAEARGVAFVPLYTRRLLALLVIGLAHAFLLWEGDILILYAVLGGLLLLFRERAPRTLLIWSAVCVSIPILINTALFGLIQLGYMNGMGPGIEQEFAQVTAGYQAQAEQAIHIYSQGSYGEILGQRVRDLSFMYATPIFFLAPNVFGMFLLGLYIGRQGLFQHVEAHATLFRRVQVWGLSLGLVGSAVYLYSMEVSNRAIPSLMTILGSIGYGVGGAALMLGYVATMTRLYQRDGWATRLAPLASVGRMALTNYLTHSLFYVLVFQSPGLGLFGQTGPALNLALVVGLYAGQVVFSGWWLRRFQFGPAEWLWRSLTYLHPQPLRLQTNPGINSMQPAD